MMVVGPAMLFALETETGNRAASLWGQSQWTGSGTSSPEGQKVLDEWRIKLVHQRDSEYVSGRMVTMVGGPDEDQGGDLRMR